jgi:protein involved in sex pheromone biosynthesis|nr:MAG TPA: Lysis protein [Caudoviricetes sp.]
MKKKIIAAIITATLLIAGCSDMANVSAGQENTMVSVESEQYYDIYADKDTGVMYLYVYTGRGFGSGLTVMLNADGTPKIWQGEE